MLKKKKLLIWVVVVLVIFVWQTWGPVSLNDLLQAPLAFKTPLAEAEVAVVHGSGFDQFGHLTPGGLERTAWALNLFKENIFPEVILSGGMLKNGMTESQAMINYLESQGVPRTFLIKEDQSSNTWQNVLNSAEILKEHNWSKVLIITSPFHTTRTFLVWRKVCPGCNLEVSAPETTWVTQPGLDNRWLGLYALVREYAALVYYKLSGRI